MSRIIWSCYCFILLFISQLSAQNNRAVDGYWLTEDGDAIIKIETDNNLLQGKLVWLADSLDSRGEPVRDIMNDVPQERARTINGMPVLIGFVYDNDLWKKGEIYNYKNGNSYNGKIRLDKNGQLKLTGFYGFFFFLAKTKTWTPVKNPGKYGLK